MFLERFGCFSLELGNVSTFWGLLQKQLVA